MDSGWVGEGSMMIHWDRHSLIIHCSVCRVDSKRRAKGKGEKFGQV
jgi:hypothetical protein